MLGDKICGEFIKKQAKNGTGKADGNQGGGVGGPRRGGIGGVTAVSPSLWVSPLKRVIIVGLSYYEGRIGKPTGEDSKKRVEEPQEVLQ